MSWHALDHWTPKDFTSVGGIAGSFLKGTQVRGLSIDSGLEIMSTSTFFLIALDFFFFSSCYTSHTIPLLADHLSQSQEHHGLLVFIKTSWVEAPDNGSGCPLALLPLCFMSTLSLVVKRWLLGLCYSGIPSFLPSLGSPVIWQSHLFSPWPTMDSYLQASQGCSFLWLTYSLLP